MAYTIYYLLKSNIQTKVEGVVSELLEDVENYDNATYRDGPYLVGGTQESFPSNLTPPNEIEATANQTLGSTSSFTVVTPVTPADVVADDALKIPPRFHLKTRSRYKWLDIDSNVIAWAWADQLIGISPTSFGFVP